MKIKVKNKLEKKLYNLKMLLNSGYSFDDACFLTNHTPTQALKKKCKLELMQQEENKNDDVITIDVTSSNDGVISKNYD